MTADEFKAIRASLGFTWKRLAAELGVNWRSVAAWERGEINISRRMAMAIRGLAQQHEREDRWTSPSTGTDPRGENPSANGSSEPTHPSPGSLPKRTRA